MTDVLIIGGGVAGMTAALYALRNGRSALVLEGESFGGQIAVSPRVENFPSIKEITGLELSNKLYEQIESLGAEFDFGRAQKVEKKDGYFTVTTDYGTLSARAVVVATGVKHKHLNLANEDKLLGHGISYCAICDGPFYAGKEVALVGDGNTAMQYAMLLSGYCPKVYVYTLFDKFFGDNYLVKLLKEKKNIEVRPNTKLTAYRGTEELDGIVYEENGVVKTHDISALFVAIGQIPDNGNFGGLADLDKDGYFVSDENCLTKTEGLFVAGDCRAKKVRQLTTAASDGATAAMAVCAYLDDIESQA